MQMTFGMYEDENRRKKATMLDKIGDVIDFSKLENLLLKMYRSHTGRPPILLLMLFKALLLESWYGLSDVEVVQEIHDRRSFERFIGEGIRQYHLDDTTLVKFRGRLRESGLIEQLWSEVDKALQRKGVKVKKGTIVDSTLVEGACRPKSLCKDGSLVDKDSGYTVRNGKGVCGYKVHVGMDHGSLLIRKMELAGSRSMIMTI